MPSKINTQHQHFIALDILRIIAATMVVVFHLFYRGPFLKEDISLPVLDFAKYGYLGVNLFFILSGFLIAQSANNKSGLKFMIKRFIRIYPAYIICLGLTIITKLALSDTSYTFLEIFTNVLLSNWILKIPSIDGVYWSLHVELMFYCLMAIIWQSVSKRNKVDHLILIWLLISLVLNNVTIENELLKILRILTLGEYAGFFIIGILFYRLYKEGLKKHLILFSVFSLLTCLRSAYTEAISLNQLKIDPWISSLIIGLFTILFPILIRLRIKKKIKILGILAGATYPLYLVHQEVGYLIVKILKLTSISSGILLVVFFFLISILINQNLEIPIQKKLKNYV